MVLFHFVLVSSNGKDIRYVRSDIEDLAFTSRSSRVSGKAGRRGCIEHDFAKGLEIRTIIGTEARVTEIGINERRTCLMAKKNLESYATQNGREPGRLTIRNKKTVLFY